MKIRNILVLLEPKAVSASPALARALALAETWKAQLRLCLFEHSAAVDAAQSVSRELARLSKLAILAERTDELSDVAEDCRRRGVINSVEVIWGRPVYRQMLKCITKHQPDLVIKDIHFEPLIKRILLTPLDWHLLRECPCPLMLVNRQAQALPGRVIAAVEPGLAEHREGQLNHLIIDAAQTLASATGTEAELAYAFDGLAPGPPRPTASQASALAEAYDQIRQKYVGRFVRLADQHQIPQERRHVLYGEPWPLLSDLAHNSLKDLLVLGTIQRSGLGRLLIGSTAERILDEARCDILAIKPERVAATRPARRRRL